MEDVVIDYTFDLTLLVDLISISLKVAPGVVSSIIRSRGTLI